MTKPTIVIQARLKSTRLPNKVGLPLPSGEGGSKSILANVIERCLRSKLPVVLAVPDNHSFFGRLSQKYDIPLYIGSEDDVLARYYYCALKYSLDPIIRITGDCPFVDYRLIREVASLYDKMGVEYCAAAINAGGYKCYPDGLDCECVSFGAIRKMHSMLMTTAYREHPTAYINANLHGFRHHIVESKSDYSDPIYKLSIDTAEDYSRARYLYSRFGDTVTWLMAVKEIRRLQKSKERM